MYRTFQLILKNYLDKNEKIQIFYLFIFTLLIPVFELLSVATLGSLVIIIIDQDKLINILPTESLKTLFLSFDKFMFLKISAITACLVIILKNLIIFIYFYFEKKLQNNLVISHTKILIKNFLSLNYDNQIKLNLNELQNDILYQSKKISSYIFHFIGFIKDILIASLFIFSLFFVNFQASTLIMMVSIITAIIFYKLSNNKIKLIGDIARSLESEQIKLINNLVNGIKTITIFQKQEFFYNKIYKTINKFLNYQLIYILIQKIPRLMIENIFVIFLVAYLILKANSNTFDDVLTFFVFLTVASVRLIPIFSNINTTIAHLKFNQIAIQKMSQNIQNKQLDKIKVRINDFNNGKNNVKKINNIKLENVSFNFDDNKILSDINLSFVTNKIYCFVGKTGCGKSTLIDIILGLYEPKKGRVLINNKIELNKTNLASYFDKLAFVPQENFLLNDSIKNNIILTDDINDEFDQKKYQEIISSLLLEDLNEKFDPSQKNKITVGDRGARISGGEIQRIGIARALYKDRDILTLDESTSSLDLNTESKIFDKLNKIKLNKIIILIAHRLSAIQKCDEVILLKEGKIDFIGTSKDYLNRIKNDL